MRKISFFIIAIFTIFEIYAQSYGKKQQSKNYYFAFKIMPGVADELVQFAVIKNDNKGIDEISFLTKQSWVRQISGKEISKANPNKENLLIKYKLFKIPDKVQREGDVSVSEYTMYKTIQLLNNLWRLRYYEYPYRFYKGSTKGWAKNLNHKIRTLPSNNQFEILKTYGIENFNNFFYGENVYRLLRDVGNTAWQNNYAESIDMDPNEPSSKKK